MRLFAPQLQIGDQEGFSAGKDLFERASIGQGLTNLVSSITDPLVIALDGPWGSGKTTFLKMWAGELRKRNIPVIHFDAFEHDYLSDAFIALASEVIGLAQENEEVDKSKREEFINKAKAAGSVLIRSALKVGVKAATLGIIDASDIKQFEAIGSDVADQTSSWVDRHLGERLTQSKTEKDILQGFRDALSNLPALIRKSGSDTTQNGPLIFIVDELDRCRPHFALELLERMKHFFSVPNVHFVLGVNLRQLRNQVCATYGDGIDANAYLQKFIQISVMVEKYSDKYNRGDVDIYVDRLFQWHSIENVDGYALNSAKMLIKHVAKRRSVSFRALERIMTNLVFSYASTNSHDFRPAAIVTGLCIIKVLEPQVYIEARNKKINYDSVANVLAFNDSDVDSNINNMSIQWRACLKVSRDSHEEKMLDSLLSTANVSYNNGSEIIPDICWNVVDRIGV